MWNNSLRELWNLMLSHQVKWNKSTHARRHFTLRSNISHAKRISQIPQGIYFVEKDLCFVSKHRSFSGGEGGIWTLDTLLGYTRFPIVRARPATRLLHLRGSATDLHIIAHLTPFVKYYFSISAIIWFSVNGRTDCCTIPRRIHVSSANPHAFPAQLFVRLAWQGWCLPPEW